LTSVTLIDNVILKIDNWVQATATFPGGRFYYARWSVSRLMVQSGSGGTSWTKRRRTAFLARLRESANVSAAARAAGLSRSSAYALRSRDPEFRAAWDEALEEALDDLEAELRRRAIEGVDKPVFYGGKECGSVKSYSDTLGMFLLKSRRGEVFAETGGRPPTLEVERELSEAKERLARTLERMNRRPETGGTSRDGNNRDGDNDA